MEKNVPGHLTKEYANLLIELKKQITASRYKAARAINKELIYLYHGIGKSILENQIKFGWGSKVISKLSQDLMSSFPGMKGFSPANLHNMRRFAECYPDEAIFQTVSGELPWSHHVALMEKVKDPDERQFYMKNAIEQGWSHSNLVM
ncbi:MAG: hypothetical protein J0G29_04190 [Alphaproteobacteria bacterium]|nr:hypothetical protein [Alphaproteobacteria bacterium]OJV44990.1 MAG: hypothetical protein BGO28_05485 [Alphaproteobacteria bacterium 43-37]